MSYMTPEERWKARELCDKATAGPWYTVDRPWRMDDHPTWVIAGSYDPHLGKQVCDGIHIDSWEGDENDGPDYTQSDRDLSFIAEVRALLPKALDELDRLNNVVLPTTVKRLARQMEKIAQLRSKLAQITICLETYTDSRMMHAYLLSFLEIQNAEVRKVPMKCCEFCGVYTGGFK
ncbi:MAG: hypothetical protein ACRD3W_06530 [Terriglobales bacterium]